MFSKLSKKDFAINHYRFGWDVPSEWLDLLAADEKPSWNFIDRRDYRSWMNIRRQPKVLKAYKARIAEL